MKRSSATIHRCHPRRQPVENCPTVCVCRDARPCFAGRKLSRCRLVFHFRLFGVRIRFRPHFPLFRTTLLFIVVPALFGRFDFARVGALNVLLLSSSTSISVFSCSESIDPYTYVINALPGVVYKSRMVLL
jgi:hypothetical protein